MFYFISDRAKLKVENSIYTIRSTLSIRQVVLYSCQLDCVIGLKMRIYFELGIGKLNILADRYIVI